ncbi:DUF968 domain-containing protein, partial [Edwardsiella tarda]|uniref:DUF968 domain-containing protein n=1 Tax=Edwardsiella tarda TaxID=636 RepID=UPI0023A9542E
MTTVWGRPVSLKSNRGAAVQAVIPQPVIKLVADEAPAAGFMLRPKLLRWESSKYTRWVKTQPCC